jgi:ATP-dependent protease ClpP protease subunit
LQVIGQAFGNAAMILASGKKGQRYALPNARIMTAPPRLNRSFGSVSNVMIKANELEQSTQVAGGGGGAVRVMVMMVGRGTIWWCW